MKKQFQNKTKIIRTREKKYTIINNSLIQNPNLSGIAKSILIRLLSNADDYIINKSLIEKQSIIGRSAFNKAWKELEDAGHISKKALKGGYLWTIYEVPLKS